MNKQRLTVNFTIIATLAVIFGSTTSSTNSVWAATIHCPNSTGNPPFFENCLGTNDADRMLGTVNSDRMDGRSGDDTMFGFARNDVMLGWVGDDTMSGGTGDDFMAGLVGKDKINGDSGNDIIEGEFDADILKGSSGNDQIFHWNRGLTTQPDDAKDEIDCGSGNNDVAWINLSDGDTAVNCETVHTEITDPPEN